MTNKKIRDEALRQVMWRVGNTNNDVTRYIADAVAEKVVRDEAVEQVQAQYNCHAERPCPRNLTRCCCQCDVIDCPERCSEYGADAYKECGGAVQEEEEK